MESVTSRRFYMRAAARASIDNIIYRVRAHCYVEHYNAL